MSFYRKIINFLCFSLLCLGGLIDAKGLSSQDDSYHKLCGMIIYDKRPDLKVVKEFKRLLNESKIDVNYQCEGDTLLSYAVRKNRVEIMKILLAAGANPNLKSGIGSFLRSSIIYNAQKAEDAIKILLAAGAIPDLTFEYKITALREASSQGLVRIVKMLLAAGANPNALDHLGRTPLIASLSEYMGEGHIEIKLETVKALLDAGANPNIIGNNGNTALRLANDIEVAKIRLEIIKALEAAGAK